MIILFPDLAIIGQRLGGKRSQCLTQHSGRQPVRAWRPSTETGLRGRTPRLALFQGTFPVLPAYTGRPKLCTKTTAHLPPNGSTSIHETCRKGAAALGPHRTPPTLACSSGTLKLPAAVTRPQPQGCSSIKQFQDCCGNSLTEEDRPSSLTPIPYGVPTTSHTVRFHCSLTRTNESTGEEGLSPGACLPHPQSSCPPEASPPSWMTASP